MQTSRLILRDLRDSDADALARELASFAITRNTSSIPHPYHYSDAVDFIARQKAKTSASVKKVIALKVAPEELIGSIRLHIDAEKNTCELGYWIAEPHWNKGYATEAGIFMVDHAFTAYTFDEIIGDFSTDNPASGRVLQHLGFSETGSSEGYSAAQGKMVPVKLVRLSQEDWAKKN